MLMKLFFASVSILVLMPNAAARAAYCEPPTVERDSPYRYLASLANALVYAKEGLDRVGASDPKGGAYSILVALKLQQSDYRCAESQVAPYAVSPDTLIREGAQTTTGIFHRLSELDDELVSQAKALLDSSGTLTPGTFAERQANVDLALEQTWKLLVDAAIFSTYTVVRGDPSTGKMSRLALTSEQRDDILGLLRAGFGTGIMSGMKAGQHPLQAAAAALYQVIGNRRYTLNKTR